MSSLPFIPADPAGEEWDVVIVGTGMGGSTVGFELAKRGHRVLFIEKGKYLFGDHDRGTGYYPVSAVAPEARLNRGAWPLKLEGRTELGEVKLFAPLGCGTGGSTSLYAAQLERLNPVDFEPRKQYPNASESTVPEAWPITYEELVPYYRRAETLFEVCGTQDPLQTDPGATLLEPPPISPRDADFFKSFEAHSSLGRLRCTPPSSRTCPIVGRFVSPESGFERGKVRFPQSARSVGETSRQEVDWV